MKKDRERIKETIKFLKWTRKYNGLWQLVCEAGNEHMNIEKMQMLIKRLEKKEFYEIIFVLLEVHKSEEFMKSVNDALLKDLLISELENGNKDEIINKLIAYLE